MSPTYFTNASFRFLRQLAANNSREWFTAHKADYDAQLRKPYLRLIADLQGPLAEISPHYRADPRPVGGSLFRIHRDTRFSNDKTPYKNHAGAQFFHARGKEVAAPVFYLHLQPGASFIGAGVWHPETAVQRRIRDFIVNNPGSWKAAVHDGRFAKRYTLGGDTLVRPPRGYPADHELINDLKRKDFVAMTPLPDAAFTDDALLDTVSDHFKGLAPLVDYLCAALDLEF